MMKECGNMATCKECKLYESIDGTKVNCFGYEIPAERNVNECFATTYQPK